MIETFPGVASGTIQPARYVSLDTANSMQLSQTGANGTIFGISGNWSNGVTLNGSSPPPHATIGQQVVGYIAPTICQLTIGTGGCAVGDKLASDANGQGVVTTTSGVSYGSIALQAVAAGQIAQVATVPPYTYVH